MAFAAANPPQRRPPRPGPADAYDARGFRVQTLEYTGGTHTATRDFYYTSRWQCVEETVTDASTQTTTLDRQYVWGLRYIDDLVRRDRDTTGNGTLDETLYALNDRQFNVIALWDPTANSGAGGIVERVCYTPYGQPQFLNEDFTTKANTNYAWTVLFQGLPRDPATGLIHNRARELHPLLGRFLQRDPLGYPDGLNAYAAYHVMWAGMDPSGQFTTANDPRALVLMASISGLTAQQIAASLGFSLEMVLAILNGTWSPGMELPVPSIPRITLPDLTRNPGQSKPEKETPRFDTPSLPRDVPAPGPQVRPTHDTPAPPIARPWPDAVPAPQPFPPAWPKPDWWPWLIPWVLPLSVPNDDLFDDSYEDYIHPEDRWMYALCEWDREVFFDGGFDFIYSWTLTIAYCGSEELPWDCCLSRGYPILAGIYLYPWKLRSAVRMR